MVPGVVADEMAGAVHAAHQVGLLAGVFPHEEKCGLDFMLRQSFQQERGPAGVGAVIKSECDFAGVSRGDKGTAVDLGGGPAGRIGARSNSESYARRRDQCCANPGGEIEIRQGHLSKPLSHDAPSHFASAKP